MGKIAKKWEYKDQTDPKYGKCTEAADEMERYLQKNKLHGALIELEWNPRSTSIIGSRSAGKRVSDNGYHVGVLYDGKVYCNVHPDGFVKQTWIDDFYILNPPATKTVREISF